MSSQITFAELYKTWSTDKLLDIIDQAEDYLPPAVEAAKLEIHSRQLSAEELKAAKAIREERLKASVKSQKRIKATGDKIKSAAAFFADKFNPVQGETNNTDTYIRLVCLFLAGLFIYHVYQDFALLQFIFSEESAEWDFSTIIIFIPWILLPAASALIWLRKKPGWIHSVLFFSFSAASAAAACYSTLGRQPTGNTALDNLFPVVSPATYAGTFLLFAGATWAMARDKIMEVYQIDRITMYISICSGIAAFIAVRSALH